MKYEEQEIIEKAKQILKDLRGEYYSDNSIDGIVFNEEKVLFTGKDQGKKHPVWTVGVHSLFDNEDLLHISDETGEPIYYQNFNTIVFDVKKDLEGKYYKTIAS